MTSRAAIRRSVKAALVLPVVLLAAITPGVVRETPGPAVAHPVVVDVDCVRVGELGPGGELRIIHWQTAQSCPPGGPCHVILDEPLDAGALELWVDGCAEPLPGRFVSTDLTCEGRPVWRWVGAMFGGLDYTIEAGPDRTLASVTLTGARQEPTCPPPARARPAGPARTVEHHPHTERTWFPQASFRAYVPEGDAPAGVGLAWDVDAARARVAEKGT